MYISPVIIVIASVLGLLIEVNSTSLQATPKKIISDATRPFYIRFDSDGSAFVIDHRNGGYVYHYDMDGNFITSFQPGGYPCDIAFKDDYLFIIDFQNNKVYNYTKSGQLLGTVLNPPQPVSIAIDCDGNFYIGEWSAGKINVYGSDFSFKREITGIGTYPRKIQFDSNDLIRVSSHYARAVYVFTKCGRLVKKIPAPDVTYAEGLFVDSNDNMYMSVRTDPGSVHIINNDGSEVLQLTGYKGVGDAVVAPDGTLWVSDVLGGTIFLY